MPSLIPAPIELHYEDDGQLLEAGKIYVGLPGLDPESNPKPAFFNASGTIVAAQPIRTIQGRADHDGAPSNIYTDGSYSIRITDKNDVTLFESLTVPGQNIDVKTAYESNDNTNAFTDEAQDRVSEIPALLAMVPKVEDLCQTQLDQDAAIAGANGIAQQAQQGVTDNAAAIGLGGIGGVATREALYADTAAPEDTLMRVVGDPQHDSNDVNDPAYNAITNPLNVRDGIYRRQTSSPNGWVRDQSYDPILLERENIFDEVDAREFFEGTVTPQSDITWVPGISIFTTPQANAGVWSGFYSPYAVDSLVTFGVYQVETNGDYTLISTIQRFVRAFSFISVGLPVFAGAVLGYTSSGAPEYSNGGDPVTFSLSTTDAANLTQSAAITVQHGILVAENVRHNAELGRLAYDFVDTNLSTSTVGVVPVDPAGKIVWINNILVQNRNQVTNSGVIRRIHVSVSGAGTIFAGVSRPDGAGGFIDAGTAAIDVVDGANIIDMETRLEVQQGDGLRLFFPSGGPLPLYSFGGTGLDFRTTNPNVTGNFTIDRENSGITLDYAFEVIGGILADLFQPEPNEVINPLLGQKLEMIGDSITSQNTVTGPIAAITSIDLNNLGGGGETYGRTTTPDPRDGGVYRQSFEVRADANRVIIWGGVNDYQKSGGTPLGDFNSSANPADWVDPNIPDDFYAGVIATIENVALNAPDADIMLATQIGTGFLGWGEPNPHGLRVEDYVDAVIKIGRRYSIRVIDIHAQGIINEYNAAEKAPDTTHPIPSSGAEIAPYFIDALLQSYGVFEPL